MSVLKRGKREQKFDQLEIRSVERGICPIHVHNERTVPIIAGCMAHARNGCISTSGLKSDVKIVFLDPDFHLYAKISAIRVHLRQITADYLIFECVFRTSWPKMEVLGDKIGERVVDVDS